MLHQIGSGVLGPVFRTYEPQRDRLVAVKAFRLDIVPEDVARLADALRRLVAAPVVHPNLVPIIDAGLEGTTAYLAMEYVAGETLDVALRHIAPAPLDRALPMLARIADAIDAAWAGGWGHGALHVRDVFLSPGSADVLVSGAGVVSALESVGVKPPIRRPYAAPERVAGGPCDVRADVYALGAIAHEILTRRRPAGPGEQDGSLEGNISPERRVLVRRVLAAALAEDPIHRFPTATAFVQALAAVERGEDVAALLPEAPPAVQAYAEPAVEAGPSRPLFAGLEAPESGPQPDLIAPSAAGATLIAPAFADFDMPQPAPAPMDEGREEREAHEDREEREEAESGDERQPPAAAALGEPPAAHASREAPTLVFTPSTDRDDRDDNEEEQEEIDENTHAAAARDAGADDTENADRREKYAGEDGRGSLYGRDVDVRGDDVRSAYRAAPAAAVSGGLLSADELPARSAFPWPAIAAVAIAGIALGSVLGYQVGVRRGATAAISTTATPPASTALPAGVSSDTDVAVQTPPPAPPAAGVGDAAPPAAPPPRVARGQLAVRTVPTGALVSVNGETQGSSPQTIGGLPLGEHTIRAAKPGYRTATQTVTLSANRPQRDVTLRLARSAAATPPAAPAGTSAIAINTRPAGARVWLDGREVGITPLARLRAAPGTHSIRIELTGYRPVTTTVTVRAGQTTPFNVSLERGGSD